MPVTRSRHIRCHATVPTSISSAGLELELESAALNSDSISHKPKKAPKASSCHTASSHVARTPPLLAMSQLPYSKTICVGEHTLKTTEVWPTFWYWLVERKKIDDRRRAGLPQEEWTDDEILRNTHFCNPYRILDKTSQYIITNVIERGSQEPSEILFRILLFNTFTSISTYELLERTFGTPAWSTFDFHDYAEVLGDARARGKSLYTGRFQKTAADFGNATMYLNHLDLLQSMMESGLLLMCQNSRYAVEVYEWIAEHPGMGPFSSYQLMLNLAYSSLLHFHPNDFCVPGPGAESGLSKLFGASYRRAKQADREAPVMIIRHIVAHQAEYFAQFHLDFPYLVRPGTDGDTIQLDVCDIEHALCEVDRFARIVHPGVIGSAAAKSKTLPSFRPSYVDGIPRPYILPVAWADPRRQTPCLRPGSEVPGIVKRYIVDRIVKDKIDEKGNRLFLVRWLHYSPKDDTWEEELYLREDGLGQTIDNYLKNKKVHC